MFTYAYYRLKCGYLVTKRELDPQTSLTLFGQNIQREKQREPEVTIWRSVKVCKFHVQPS